MYNRRPLLAAATLLVAAMAACQESAVVLPEPTSVSVIAPAVSMMVGDTATVAAQVLDQQGRPIAGLAPAFSSDNPSVATVSTSGMVRGVSPGTANITATYGQATATAKITVSRDSRPDVKTLTIGGPDSVFVEARVGQASTFTVPIQMFDGFGRLVCPDERGTVVSSNPLVVTAGLSGATAPDGEVLVCTLNGSVWSKGVATLTVRVDNGVDSIRVRSTESYTVSYSSRPAASELYAGNTVTFTLHVKNQVTDDPVPNVPVAADVSRGTLTTSGSKTDANGDVVMTLKLPTSLAQGTGVTLAYRAALPTGQISTGSETLTLNGAPMVSATVYRYNQSTAAATAVPNDTITAKRGEALYFLVGGFDQYGNRRVEDFTFNITPPATVFCPAGLRAQQMNGSCVNSTVVGTSTVTATAGSFTKTFWIVYTN